MNWLQEHWVAVAATIGLLHAAAKPLIKATETKKDDAVWAFIGKLLRIIGLQPKEGNG